jgi:hypothetical protein
MQRVAIGAYPDLDIVGVRSGYFRLLRSPRGELRAGCETARWPSPCRHEASRQASPIARASARLWPNKATACVSSSLGSGQVGQPKQTQRNTDRVFKRAELVECSGQHAFGSEILALAELRIPQRVQRDGGAVLVSEGAGEREGLRLEGARKL